MTDLRLSAYTADGRRFNPIWSKWYNDSRFLIEMVQTGRAKFAKSEENLNYVDCIDFASEADLAWFLLRYS